MTKTFTVRVELRGREPFDETHNDIARAFTSAGEWARIAGTKAESTSRGWKVTEPDPMETK